MTATGLEPVSSKEFFDIQATIECGFTLKRVSEMIRTYSQTEIVLPFFMSSSKNLKPKKLKIKLKLVFLTLTTAVIRTRTLIKERF